MSDQLNIRDFAHGTAVEVYGAFLNECVGSRVINDRNGPKGKESVGKIDGRPVRLVTMSGKGGWSDDPVLAEQWGRNDNISLLDHLLSVARGALMFWLADTPRAWFSAEEFAEVERLAHAVVCIAFLHDIDKDLGLRRGAAISSADVEERMHRYGIDAFLASRRIRISPAAMLNYIEQVEGTQAARSPAASDYDPRTAEACIYVELADKLEGQFTSREQGAGIDGVLALLESWPGLQASELKQWEKVEIHDHLHVFLLDRFLRALSAACKELSGRLPLIEIVHDGRLLCIIPRAYAEDIKVKALDRFLHDLPYGLRFTVNNRLACEFVGGAASWGACREVMNPGGNWDGRFANLLALPRPFARVHREEINALFEAAGMTTSWGSFDENAVGATVKPALEYPGGDAGDLGLEPAHALAFLVIALNHADGKRKTAAPAADHRERELSACLKAQGRQPPEGVASLSDKDGRVRRILLALWSVGEMWRLADDDPDAAQALLDAVIGRDGLVGLWLDGADKRPGLSSQIEDVSSDIVNALRQRFAAHLTGRPAVSLNVGTAPKRCILCNEPVGAAWRVSTASRAHGIKTSAFSGRDGRNDHLASPSGDTHLCPVCLAELQLRQNAQDEFRGSGDLPPLISSPVSLGLFGGLAFEGEDTEVSMGLHDLNRLEIRKGSVYYGLDCQTRRIRVARLETLPNTDKELVTRLHMALRAAIRLGRPIHIFRGAPRRHPAIFYFDALPAWLERLLGGDSLRIEQLPGGLSKLELFMTLADANGLGIEWARQLADPDPMTALGALCVAWAMAVDRRGDGTKDHAWSLIENKTRERALTHIRNIGGKHMKLKDNTDPLIRLAWLATRLQKRIGIGASVNKQLLCWKIALDFYPGAQRSASTDRTALVLGLASTLEEELTRKGDAAAKKHRDSQPLDQACLTFASHFVDEVWTKVFKSKEPTSQEQRRAASIYRFALLEAYRERGIPEAPNGASTDNDSQEV